MNPAAQTVRARIALGDRLRRSRETGRRLWRGAPGAAAICAGVAAGVRWMEWPLVLSLGLIAGVLVILAAYVLAARRDRAISDATAVEMDGLARLGGELRSASWFAARDAGDSWTDYHLARAADRLQATDWGHLYPPVRAPRAKAVTAVLAIAAVFLGLPVAGSRGVHAIGSRDAARMAAPVPSPGGLPPELRKQIEELLRKAEESSLANNGRALTEAEVRDLLTRLNQSPQLENAKERNSLANPQGNPLDKSSPDLKALAERAKKASEMTSLSPEVRDALSEVADKLSDASDTQPGSPRDPKDAVATADAQTGDAAQSNKNGDKQEASVQAVKDASAGGGVGVVMMSSDDPKGAQEAGLGLGGGSSDRNGGGTMPDFAAALRKETIDAYKADEGQKSDNDLRSKTEKATATTAYRATSPASFDKGRATAPPAVPENRRAAVQTYFIRKP